MKNVVVIILLMFSLLSSAPSQGQQIEITNFLYEQQYSAYNVKLFSNGPGVWYQDNYGAAYLNGQTVVNFNKTNGLPLDSVSAIAADPNGNMLFQGGEGVVRKNSSVYEFFGMETDWAFMELVGDKLWLSAGWPLHEISFDQNGLADTTTYRPSLAYPGDYWNEIEKDSQGNYYLIPRWGHWIFSKRAGETEFLYEETSILEISAIHVDKDDNLWVGGYEGIFIKSSESEFIEVESDLIPGGVSGITSDEDGTLYFATYSGLVIIKGTEIFRIDKTHGLSSDILFDVEVDSDGNIYVASDVGVSKLKIGFENEPDGVTGLVFQDLNHDGLRNNGEPGLKNQFLKIVPGNRFAITDSNGNFSYTPSNGENTVTWIKNGFWEIGESFEESVTFSFPENTTPPLLFGLGWGEVEDVSTYVTGSAARPGFDVVYYVGYNNEGSVNASTVLQFKHDSNLNFIESNITPDVVDGNLLQWNINSLPYLARKTMTLKFNLSASTPLGSILQNSASIDVLANEINIDDNLDTLYQTVTGSADPNDKLVKEGILEERYVLLNTPLTYTIRFQNTGTDTAFTVKVKDAIDQSFELSSLKVIGTSHPYEMSVDERTITFLFDDIELPDSTRNEPGSHGFIKYAISPLDDIANNTVVSNKADIYFDFNAAVVTNEVSNRYVAVLPDGRVTGIKPSFAENVILYPNPASGTVSLKGFEKYNFSKVEILSSQGKPVSASAFSNKIETSSLPSGMYFVRLYAGQKVLTLKMSIEH